MEDFNKDNLNGENTPEFPITGAMNSGFSATENEAERLNSELFAPVPKKQKNTPEYDAGASAVKPLWGRALIAAILVICAFTGAFFGVFFVCRTSILGDSDFFDAFIAKWAGVTENRVEVDSISTEYTGDSVTLAANVLKHTVLVRTGYKKENNTFVQLNSGSGIIYARVGNTDTYYIVTNYHVISDAQNVMIEIRDELEENINNNRFDAEVKYTDEQSDIAVLKVECEKTLITATQSDSSAAKHGQSVIIAGNPLGHGFAVSFGHISNPYRVTTANNNIPMMTLDAAVNFGNSGGGVYDAEGNLLGLVSSKASGEDVDGIGYAIPINTVNEIVSDLLEFGYVKGRPALGIEVLGLFNAASYSYAQAGQLNGTIFSTVNPHYGVYVVTSQNALLQKGDRIVELDGTEITASADISKVLLGKKPGNSISITVERQSLSDSDGEIVYTQVTFDILLIERNFAD